MKKVILIISCFCFSLMVFGQGPTIQKYMTIGANQRSYLVHFPPGYYNSQHLPVVFNLHGSTSDGAQQEFYSGMSYTSDTSGFIVVYPDGIGNEWNVGFTGAYGTGLDDVGFISTIIDTLAASYNIDTNRVYTCGMSDGGFMSYRLACELENRFAAIAAVSGNVGDSVGFYCTHTRNIPVLHIHGTADPLVLYAGDTGFYSAENTVAFWVNKNLCSNASDTTVLADIDLTDSSHVIKIHYGQCGTGTQVLFYKIIGGGHTWPNAPYPYIYGPTNHDIDGSGVIWDFFKQYSLSGATGVSSLTLPEGDRTMQVFPNPADGVVNLRLPEEWVGEQVEVKVMDITGRRFSANTYQNQSIVLPVSDLPQGMYFVSAEFNGHALTSRFVKE